MATEHHTDRRFGVFFLTLGIGAASWDGTRLRGLPLSDLMFVVALAVIVLMVLNGQALPVPPWWMVTILVLVGLAAAKNVMYPPPLEVLGNRYVPAANLGDPLSSVTGQNSDTGSILKFALALVIVPWMIGVFGTTRAALQKFADAWCVGVCVSALVAVLDHRGFTAIGLRQLGFVDVSGRMPGLSTHPNQLAVATALALPVALWWTLRGRRWGWASIVAIPVLILGVVATGSRGGLAGTLLAAFLTMAVIPQLRRVGYWLVIPALALLVATNGLTRFVADTRFGGSVATASNIDRAFRLAQARSDFDASPVFGVGMRFIQEGHDIYFQMLAATGLLGLVALLVYAAGALQCGRLNRDDLVARVMAVSFAMFLMMGAVQNNLLARYLYVPVGVLWALSLLRNDSKSSSTVRSSPQQARRSRPPVPSRRSVSPAR
jgi:hypothetical protein